MNILTIGTGTWGLALTKVLNENKHQVYAYSPSSNGVKSLRETRRSKNLDVVFDERIIFVDDFKEVIDQVELILIASPSVYIRKVSESIKDFVKKEQIVVNVAKGIEQDSCLTMSKVIAEVLQRDDIVTLSGPTHAEEVVKQLPTTIVASSVDEAKAIIVQEVFSNEYFRVYTNDDSLGIEICGALKNIVALACGISKGLGYGDNVVAGIITRGAFEIKKIGMKLNCQENTFYGLAGIGDLIVTGTSVHSRNFKCGYLIGQGLSAEKAIEEVQMVVEGINVLKPAMTLANRLNVEAPIISAVYDIVFNKLEPKQAAKSLMTRVYKSEK